MEEIMKEFEEGVEMLYIQINEKYNNDFRDKVKITVRPNNKYKQIKKKAIKNVALVIDGKERVYVYKSAGHRNKFRSDQREYYKECCKNYDIPYIDKMYDTLVRFYWKISSEEQKDSLIENKPNINLIEFYNTIDEYIRVQIFTVNPYYASLIKTTKLNSTS